MIPILYKSDEKDFFHNGLGLLSEALDWTVDETLNGEFEFHMVYPLVGRLFEDISEDMQIKAKPNDKDEPHVFRIYETEIDATNQTMHIYGASNVFDLLGNMVSDVIVTNATPNEAWQAIVSDAMEPISLSFHSDISTRSSTRWTRRNVLNCIAGEEGSLLQYWGGEIKRGNNWLWLYKRRGRDNVTTIRHGKNLRGLSATYSKKGIVTAIVPILRQSVEGQQEDNIVIGDTVKSPYVDNYAVIYYREVEYSEEDGVTDLASLNAKAASYFIEKSGLDKPSINMKIELEDLAQTTEYERFKDFEKVELGDTITVYSEKYNIHLTAKVQRIVYNGARKKNEIIEVGTTRATQYDSYRELINDTIQPIQKELQIVQVAANGKNKIFRGVDEPTTGMVKNDIWYQPVGDGETMMYVFDGAYWQLNKVSAGLLGGTLDAENGDVNLINVNVANIVGDTSEFVRSAWNSIASRITIDGDEILTIDVSGRYVTLSNGGMRFGGGGEEIILRNNTGENPNRSGISLNPVRSTMNAVDFDINTRGNSSLHMGTSDLDLGYRLRLANEEQNKNNYYISLKTGTRFSFELNKAAAGTSTKNALEVEVMDGAGTMRVGRNPQHGSSMWLVNDDVIFAKGGTNNRVSVFAGKFAGQSFNYLEGDKIYSIEKTISSILGWIGKNGQWVE